MKLPAYETWMTGTLVYAWPFWALDCVGLRDPTPDCRSAGQGGGSGSGGPLVEPAALSGGSGAAGRPPPAGGLLAMLADLPSIWARAAWA